MNRRALLKTSFGAGIATMLGLSITSGETIENSSKDKTQEFYAFFEEVNEFPINEEQKDAYCFYNNGCKIYRELRKQGMSTLQSTIAFHEAFVNKKNVASTVNTVLQGYNSYELLINQIKNHRTLTMKAVIDLEHPDFGSVVNFPSGGSIAFIVFCEEQNYQSLKNRKYDIALINSDYHPLNGKKIIPRIINTDRSFYIGTGESEKLILF